MSNDNTKIGYQDYVLGSKLTLNQKKELSNEFVVQDKLIFNVYAKQETFTGSNGFKASMNVYVFARNNDNIIDWITLEFDNLPIDSGDDIDIQEEFVVLIINSLHKKYRSIRGSKTISSEVYYGFDYYRKKNWYADIIYEMKNGDRIRLKWDNLLLMVRYSTKSGRDALIAYNDINRKKCIDSL